MSAMSNEQFARRVMLSARPADEFEPRADYDPDGDCIEFLAKPDPFYAERVDDLVTVYYSEKTGEVIGSLIKGVKSLYEALREKMPGFMVAIEDGSVRLEHVFLAALWMQGGSPEAIPALTYKKLADIAERSAVQTHICAPAV